ncbi:YadA-like family protein [Pseudoxanthomonas japonensis]|uniref:YadA-like family protein n=1 Tax=Pseudoxanthomonas japonensis TaxID=69284 RepID=UPI001BD06654|nr:YadA-like family protein [Pseudoxanthomonas japonensis]
MNRIFRKVWRPTLGQWVVASEFAKRPGGVGPVRMALAGDRTHVNAVAAAVLLALGACPDRALALDAVCRDPATGVAVGNAGAAGDQVACGQGAVAGGTSAVAIGIDVLAGTSSSVAIGDRAQATGLSATAIGLQAVATGRYSVALGAGADALGELAYAMGNEARANARDVAIGAGALSSSSGSANGSVESVAIGSQAGMNATNVARSTFVGANAGATSVGAENTYVGYQAGAETNGTRNAYAGYNAGLTSQGSFNVAAGNYAYAAGNGSYNVAQGAGAAALVTGSHNVAIGDHAGTRAQLDANGNPVGMTASSYSHSVNIGSNTQALADEAVAIGRASAVASQQGTAVGASSQAAGLAGTALGFGSSAAGTYSVAVGDSTAGAANSVAVGRNASASANDATAIGGADAPADAARAQGARSTALGWGATAAATGSISVGDSSASTQNTIAIGTGATATGTGAIEGAVAIGYNARATQYLSLALGTRSTASNYWAIAIGDLSTASGSDSLAVGSALASGAASTAVGVLATAEDESAVAVGGGARATGEQSIAIGGGDYATTSMSDGASASGDRAISIGYRAAATVDDGVALGSHSVAATAAGIAGYDPRTGLSSNDASPAWTSTLAAVSVGGAGQTRQITNVAAGTQDTDAVNVAQLQAAQTHYYSVNDDGTPGTNYNNEGATAEQALAAGVSARATDVAATAVGFDSQASGANAIAIGTSSRATQTYSTALGYSATATGQSGVAIGFAAQAVGAGNIAIGHGSETGTANDATAIGVFAVANGARAVALGSAAGAEGADAIAIGTGASAVGERSISIGTGNVVNGARSGAIGDPSIIDADDSYSVGNNNTLGAAANNSFVLGNNVSIDVDNATALGNATSVTQAGGVALGSQSVASTASGVAGYDPRTGLPSTDTAATWVSTLAAVSVGSAGNTRQITNVAAGTQATDAVNVAQLQAAQTHYYSVNDDGVVDGNYNNDGATGSNALAAGVGASASGARSVAIGYNAMATGIGTAAVGNGAGRGATGTYNALFGEDAGAESSGNQNTHVGFGAGAFAEGDNNATLGAGAGSATRGNANVAVGYLAGLVTTGHANVATGSGAGHYTTGDYNVASGASAGVGTTGNDNVAIGRAAGTGYFMDPDTGEIVDRDGNPVAVSPVARNQTVAIGNWAVASADGAVAVGAEAQALAGRSVAMGTGAIVSAEDSVALGANSMADGSTLADAAYSPTGNAADIAGVTPIGEVSVGSAGSERRITHVAAGANATDAVNVSQLQAAQAHYYSVNDNGVVGGNYANDGATGTNALAAGVNAVASSANGLAMGAGAQAANGSGNVALGNGALSSATASGVGDAIAIGTSARSTREGAVALGRESSAVGVQSIALGDGAIAGGSGAAGGGNAIAIGTDASAVEANAIALGRGASVGAGVVDGAAFGRNAVVTANTGVALGYGSRATVAAGVAGYDPATGTASTASTPTWRSTLGAVSVGNGTSATRQITGVAAGAAPTDAVNVAQLTAVQGLATAGWNVTDAAGNAANIGPNGTVTFQGDANLAVTQTGADDDGVVDITLNRDLDVDSVTAGDSTLDTDGLTVDDGAGNVSTVGAGTIGVTDANGTTAIGGNAISVGGANPIVISGDTGTIGGLTNTTWDPDNFTSGQAATEDQLALVGSAANAGWNATDAAGNTANIGPNGTVTFESGDANIVVSQTGVDDDGVVDITLSNTLDLTAAGSVTIGDTAMNGAGVAVGTTVTLGNAGLSVIGGTTTTVVNGDGLTSGSVVVSGASNDVTGLSNTTLTDPTFATAGRAATEEQLQRVDQVANAGWNATDAAGNTANIGPGGTVRFQGDANLAVAQTGADDDGVVDITLNRDLDVDSVTAGSTVVDDSGLTITGGPSVTTAGIDAGGTVITNVAAGVAATDAVNVSQLTAVETAANAGWNATDAAGNTANIGPDGRVRFESGNANIAVSQTGVDDDGVVDVTLSDTLDLSASGSVTTGQTVLNNAGVTVGTNVALGSGGLTVIGGTTTTVLSGSGLTSGNVVLSGTSNTLAGLSNRTLFDPTFATAGRAATEEQLRQVRNEITSGFTPPTRYYGVNSLGGGNQLGEGATGEDAMALGKDAASDGQDAVAMGRGARATEDDSMALGAGSQALSLNALALGAGAVASHENSIALGAGSATTVGARADYQGAYVGSSSSSGEMNIGGRQLTGVAAGSAATDAVNVSQLQGGVTHAINEANAYTDARIATIEGDLVDIRGDITDIQGDIVRIEGDITNLDTRVGDVEGSVANLTTTVNQFDNRVTNLERGGSGPFRITQGETYVAPAPTGANASAGGNGAVASGDNSTAVGNQSVASGDNSTAIGQGAVASHDNSVALGRGSATTVGAQRGYNAAYVGTSTSTGEVNLGGRTISGVAPGIAGTDAVNVNQLDAGVDYAINQANAYTDDRFTRFDGDMWNLERGYRGGTASAMAMAGLPQAYLPGKSMLSVAFGGYQGEYGMAFGLSTITDNGRWVYKAQATGNTTRDWGFSVGAGLQW